MRIAIVGAGRVGTAFAVLLGRAGHAIVGVSGREATGRRAGSHVPGVPVTDVQALVPTAELVFVTVPDDAIGTTVGEVVAAGVEGRWVAHASGALGLAPLLPVLDAGGRRLAVHPLQTLPTVERAIAGIPGCTVAITADDEEGAALGERLAGDLGAVPFRLAEELRPLYHAAAVLASNDVVTLAGIAEGLLRQAGVPDPRSALAPLLRATVENVAAIGPSDALTGPAVRGDAGTIERNLTALAAHAPATVAAYVVLCRAALDLAVSAGRLGLDGRARVEEVLARWT
jgi:predicted short-subunit dehydrogenase-like oxidoreductase (DUF2520 family)